MQLHSKFHNNIWNKKLRKFLSINTYTRPCTTRDPLFFFTEHSVLLHLIYFSLLYPSLMTITENDRGLLMAGLLMTESMFLFAGLVNCHLVWVWYTILASSDGPFVLLGCCVSMLPTCLHMLLAFFSFPFALNPFSYFSQAHIPFVLVASFVLMYCLSGVILE